MIFIYIVIFLIACLIIEKLMNFKTFYLSVKLQNLKYTIKEQAYAAGNK